MPAPVPLQDKLVWRCDQLLRSRESDERRYREQRLPWDGSLLQRVREGSLRLCLAFIR